MSYKHQPIQHSESENNLYHIEKERMELLLILSLCYLPVVYLSLELEEISLFALSLSTS